MRSLLPATAWFKGKESSASRNPSAEGMGSPCGSCSGCPNNSASRSVNASDTACSNLSASLCTSCQSYPRCSRRKVSISLCRLTSRRAGLVLATLGERGPPVTLVLDQAHLLQPREHVGDRGRRDGEPRRHLLRRSRVPRVRRKLPDGLQIISHR